MTTTAPSAPAGQLLLPGQAAAPDGPVDLTLMWLMHRGFRRDVDAFARAAERTPVDDRRTWQALHRRWELFATTLHHHHVGEDAGLWPLLLDRVDAAGDTAGRATLEAMSAEHAGLDPQLAACSAGFLRLAAEPDERARRVLATQLATVRADLGRHLAHEERDAMRVLQDHLAPADWDRIGRAYFDSAYSPRGLLAVVAWALHDLPADALARLRGVDRMPALLAVWRLFLRRGFARRERRAFRYA